jgi:hypothetical protein
MSKSWTVSVAAAAVLAVLPACLDQEGPDSQDPSPEVAERRAADLALGHALPQGLIEKIADYAGHTRDVVALATELGGKGERGLITHGTLRQDAAGTEYWPEPTDRLVVERPRWPREVLFIKELSGDMEASSAGFLQGPHVVDVAVVIDGYAQVRVRSERTGDGAAASSMAGYDTYQGARYKVDVSGTGSYTESRTNTRITRVSEQRFTGIIAGDGRRIDVDETWSHELVSTVGLAYYARAYHMRVIDNRMVSGGDELRWMSATIEKQFENGAPAAIDESWSAEGVVLLNGEELARYTFEPNDDVGPGQPGYGFVLLTPDRRVPVE